ncbi:DEAD-domain-containing protein [Microstroma glucosiphilum]|uniref:RNA helicase n=1 Tax=Pseudomicrostroma glucosiphilum TaxID=1684307 RepID=A0A316UAZ5_9BASI|nr:DEAD-domain-containing protein [Pseudomicrostroma glucosiphilum]PWN20215.1 DEAD-domain-containing protein [Pseudomicrostroma glucosiphilum]
MDDVVNNEAGPSNSAAGKTNGAQVAALSMPAAPSTDDLPTFASISHLLSPPILLALSTLRFSHPTPVQAQVLPLALSGHDIVARARTGSGKTLAYGLPIVQKILKTKEALGKSSGDYQRTRGLILVPTRELSEQVANHVGRICAGSGEDLKVVNIAREASSSVLKLLLADRPDIIVATPSRALHFVQSQTLPLDHLDSLVLDEADLLLSYGHDEAVKALFSGNHLPKTYQSFLMSATMSQDVEALRSLLSSSSSSTRKPQVLNLKDDAHTHTHLAQYYVHLSNEDDKFLLLYVLLKLRLVRGKVLVFVNDVDRGYKVRLFLEAFGVRSCVLNAEMPGNSRYHVVQEFNKGVYDVIIATDEGARDIKGDERLMKEEEEGGQEEDEEEEVAEAEDDEEAEGEDDEEDLDEANEATATSDKKRKRPSPSPEAVAPSKASKKKKSKSSTATAATEYGVSRGIDFVNVSCVVNFDLPVSLSSYIHRIGRTARAHQSGIALSFIVSPGVNSDGTKTVTTSSSTTGMKGTASPTSALDPSTWKKISRHFKRLASPAAGGVSPLQAWKIDWSLVTGFRYRMEDALRATTRHRVKEARIKEIKLEILRSKRLREHFEDNPRDFEYLRHDGKVGGGGAAGQGHLKHVPDYLLPKGMGVRGLKAPRVESEAGIQGKVSYDEQGRSLGYVGMRKNAAGRGRGGAARGRGRGGAGRGGSSMRGKKKDPLRVGKK